MLKGKRAVVTGSTSGIGLGIAKALAQAGADLVLNGSRAPNPDIHALREGLERDFGVRAIYCSADLCSADQVRELIAVAERELGGVDILVNNAGIQHVAPVEEFPDDKWEKLIALNLSSAFYAIKAVLPGMKKRNWGRIINIASAHAPRGFTLQILLRRRQAWPARTDQGGGAGDCRRRHHLQCHLPRLCTHSARGRADREPGEGARTQPRAGNTRRDSRRAGEEALR